MNKGTKQLLLVGGSLIVLGGIIYYFIKKGRDTGGEIMDETIEQAVDSTKPEVKTKPQGTPVSKAGKAPEQLNTVEKVKAFQDWMDKTIKKPWINVDGKWHFLNTGEPNVKGKGYGNFVPSTAKVWDVFGFRYLQEKGK
jgi:hypothetical protein